VFQNEIEGVIRVLMRAHEPFESGVQGNLDHKKTPYPRTLRLLPRSYGGPSSGAFSYERGTPAEGEGSKSHTGGMIRGG
jgi:hypothetical protein